MHSQLNIYTDGSKTDTGTGAGYVIFDKDKLVHKDYIPLAPTATVFQAEAIAITYAAKLIFKLKKTLQPKYVKFFSDSRSVLQSLNNFKTTSTVIQDTIDALNKLGSLTQRITLNWIKAHNDHRGNEYADIMANHAAQCTQEQSIVPIAHNLYKAHIKTAIYAEWISQWQQDLNKYKHTRIFFPRMEPKYSKQILKLNRSDLKLLVEIITGHTNLKTFSTKMKPQPNTLCTFCKLEPETILHLLSDCTHFKETRKSLKIHRFLPQSYANHNLTWSIPLLLEFFKTPELLNIISPQKVKP